MTREPVRCFDDVIYRTSQEFVLVLAISPVLATVNGRGIAEKAMFLLSKFSRMAKSGRAGRVMVLTQRSSGGFRVLSSPAFANDSFASLCERESSDDLRGGI